MRHQTALDPTVVSCDTIIDEPMIWTIYLLILAVWREFPLFQFVLTCCSVSAVSPHGCPCDAGRSGYLVWQRSHRGQLCPWSHAWPISQVASAEPAAEDQTWQCTVHHVRHTKKTIPRWCVKLLEQVSKQFSSSLFSGVDFDGSTVGLANVNAMCTANSGAVNEVLFLL